MNSQEKRQYEALLRTQAFLAANPASPPVSYTEPKAVLDEVISRLSEHTGAQVLGLRQSKAQQRRQATAVRRLRDHHMRPIVAIAQAKAEVEGDAGLGLLLRMPHGSVGVTRLMAAAEAMREAATPIADSFVANGRPADFLEQLAAAIAGVRDSIWDRATILGTHVGAKAGIKQQLRRGRLAVVRLDSIVRVAFEGNDVVLARWRVTTRVKGPHGGGGPVPTTGPVLVPDGGSAAA